MQSEQFQLHADIEARHWWFVARRQILAEVIGAVLPASKQTTIVDVGCGTGANLATLADRYDCVGIDTSADAIRLAQARFPGVEFIHGVAPRDLGPAIDRAALVLISDVLEHVADDFRLASELLATMRPGSFLLVTVPADSTLWSGHDRAFGHYRRYDAARLASVWQGLPVETIFLSHFNSRLYPIVKAVRMWNQHRGKTDGLAGTDFRLPAAGVNAALTGIMAGERGRLSRLAKGENVRPFSHGVSLMALLRRGEGSIEPRSKPGNVAADVHDPAAELLAADV